VYLIAFEMQHYVGDIFCCRTNLGKLRAWLRLAMMQKTLAGYFSELIELREKLLVYVLCDCIHSLCMKLAYAASCCAFKSMFMCPDSYQKLALLYINNFSLTYLRSWKAQRHHLSRYGYHDSALPHIFFSLCD